MTTTIQAQCDKCKAPLTVRVGRKSTVREAGCAPCGTRWDYSCWRLGSRDLVARRSDGTRIVVAKDGLDMFRVEFSEHVPALRSIR